jgi:hypothetical protein
MRADKIQFLHAGVGLHPIVGVLRQGIQFRSRGTRPKAVQNFILAIAFVNNLHICFTIFGCQSPYKHNIKGTNSN